jgi:hypothetical protein
LEPAAATEEGRAVAATEQEIRPGVIRRRQTISGQSTPTPRPVTRPPLARILTHIDELEQAGAISPQRAAQMRMSGGTQLAVHAEVQASIAQPNQPIVVNRPMCSSCFEYFRAEAKFRQRAQTVADPQRIRVFHPDGRIEHFSISGEPEAEIGIHD